jgi:NAD-dependent deacetylase
VVWFGEMPHSTDEVHRALYDCEVFAAIGTSGVVLPAAAFLHYALAVGARTVELNLEPTAQTDFDEHRHGPATEVVPTWVDELLGDAR